MNTIKNTFKKIYALSKFETNIATDDKFIFVYTLVFPAVYFIYVFFSQHPTTNTHGIYFTLTGFWSYILVMGISTGFIGGIMDMKMTNFLKMFYFITGNKTDIYYANLIPQMVIIQVEILIFDLLAGILLHISLTMFLAMLGAFLVNFLLIPIIAGFMFFFFLVPFKKLQAYTIFSTGYMFIGLGLLVVSNNSQLINTLLMIINPFTYITRVYYLTQGFSFSLFSLILILLIAVIYLTINAITIKKMDIVSTMQR